MLKKTKVRQCFDSRRGWNRLYNSRLLARAGVGKITLIDADTIETSNLQRQIAFTPADIGQFKSDTLAKRLMQINPHIRVEFYVGKLDQSNADEFVRQQDLVLDGCDNFTTRYVVNAACKKCNTIN